VTLPEIDRPDAERERLTLASVVLVDKSFAHKSKILGAGMIVEYTSSGLTKWPLTRVIASDIGDGVL
jgi:hypothetical protein